MSYVGHHEKGFGLGKDEKSYGECQGGKLNTQDLAQTTVRPVPS